jgi:hypothetical protein
MAVCWHVIVPRSYCVAMRCAHGRDFYCQANVSHLKKCHLTVVDTTSLKVTVKQLTERNNFAMPNNVSLVWL